MVANTGQSVHNANTLVDSYQSSLGPYGGTNVGSHGDVQAATSILVNGGVINGNRFPNSPAGLAVVPVPSGATNLGTFLLNGGQSRALAAGNYVASSFTMNGNSTLTVTGGIVQIWVTGTLILGGQANNNGVPENLEFLMTGTSDVHVNGGASVFAEIYAPVASVLVDAPVFGSVVGASTTTVNSGGRVHFDQSSQCPSAPPPASCLPPSALGVLSASGGNVNVYIPNGDYLDSATGVQVVPIEGTGARATIPTTNTVNSCASNSTTGKTVCVANNTDVYVIAGSTVSNVLTSGATGTQVFSGGPCVNCSVAMDAVHNRAVVTVGLAGGPPNIGIGGFQFLDLSTNLFSAPISAGTIRTGELVLIDPTRQLLLSPSEDNVYQLVNTSSSAVFNLTPSGITPPGQFDSPAEDCGTGIALSSVEDTGQIFLVDLTQATFSGGTWSAPTNIQTIPEFAPPALSEGTTGIAIAPGSSHIGVVSGEFGGTGFGAIRLPATSGSGTPALVDWVKADVPTDPSGAVWQMSIDPHGVTAYTSPSSGKAFAIIVNEARTFLAIVDLQALLGAARQAGTHNISPTVNLRTSGILRFVSVM